MFYRTHGRIALYFRNAVDDMTELTIRFSPSGQQLRFFANFATIVSQKPAWFKPDGAPRFLLIALILSVYRDCYFVAGAPFWLQRIVFGTLAPLARIRGYAIAIAPLPAANQGSQPGLANRNERGHRA